jgi:hypothetical protein
MIYGSLAVPSDFVPGGGEVCVMELLWTRLLPHQDLVVLFAKDRDLSIISYFP